MFREMEVGQIVSSYFNAYDEEGGMMALSGDEEKLYELLGEGIARMQEFGDVFVSDALKNSAYPLHLRYPWAYLWREICWSFP